MLECVKIVKEKFPTAQIQSFDKNLWVLVGGSGPLSNPHSSHYECWAEARMIMEQVS